MIALLTILYKKAFKMTYLEDLQNRHREIVINTCNKIGCKNCDLKWDDGCSAIELQNKILDKEDKQISNQK